jgi:hypothetical protein
VQVIDSEPAELDAALCAVATEVSAIMFFTWVTGAAVSNCTKIQISTKWRILYDSQNIIEDETKLKSNDLHTGYL